MLVTLTAFHVSPYLACRGGMCAQAVGAGTAGAAVSGMEAGADAGG